MEIDVVAYITALAPSITAVLTVILALLTMINKVSKILVNIKADNELLKKEVDKKFEDSEIEKISIQLKMLAEENSKLSK